MTQINKRYCQLPRSPSHTLPVIIPVYCVPTRVTTVSRGIHCLAFLRSFNTPAWITKFYSLISSAFSILYYIHGNMPHAFFPLTSGFLCSAICLRDSLMLLLWFRIVHSVTDAYNSIAWLPCHLCRHSLWVDIWIGSTWGLLRIMLP